MKCGTLTMHAAPGSCAAAAIPIANVSNVDLEVRVTILGHAPIKIRQNETYISVSGCDFADEGQGLAVLKVYGSSRPKSRLQRKGFEHVNRMPNGLLFSCFSKVGYGGTSSWAKARVRMPFVPTCTRVLAAIVVGFRHVLEIDST